MNNTDDFPPEAAHQLIAILIDRLGGITSLLDTDLKTGVDRSWRIERNTTNDGWTLTS